MTELTPTKLAIILTAEALFGEKGIDGVSLRQISSESGNKNVYAAQYHFGDRQNLLREIIAYRRPVLDHHRKEMVRKSGCAIEDLSIEDALTVVYAPLFAQKDDRNRRSYSRFLRALFQYDLDSEYIRADTSGPFTAALYERIRAQLPMLSDAIWTLRMRATGRWGTSVISDFDRGSMAPAGEQEIMSEIVAMISAALQARPSETRHFADVYRFALGSADAHAQIDEG